MRVVVTGAAGFIGANIVKGLNARGITDIIAVDDLRDGDKFRNLADLQITHYADHVSFYDEFAKGHYGTVEAVFHEGACSDTMETNGQYMMANNYGVTLQLLEACEAQGVRLLYASSAATYGGSSVFKETPEHESPLNVYGYSKLLFDQVARQRGGDDFSRFKTQVAGFRYFNVYGSREQHKGRMASVAFHQFHQYRSDGKVKLFGEYGGYVAGEQRRDFVYIDDVVKVNLWFFDHPKKRGVFNLGSGKSQPFNDVAVAVLNTLEGRVHTAADWHKAGKLEYVPFPEKLIGKYQCFTEADLSKLRAAGYSAPFATVQEGVSAYIKALVQSTSALVAV
jgi:ADP-L-glycero-D-manno-heptose 6-epimerase